MEAYDLLILTRSMERIVAALLGGGAIYLGFKVFASLPNANDLEDNYRFKKYLSFNLVKIVAGTTFMIFGAYMVLATTLKEVKMEQNDQNGLTQYSGARDNQKRDYREQQLIDFNNFPVYFSTINEIPKQLKHDVEPRLHRDVEIALSRLKLNLMLSTWKPEIWGDKIAFREWVLNGASGPRPESVRPDAMELYHNKL